MNRMMWQTLNRELSLGNWLVLLVAWPGFLVTIINLMVFGRTPAIQLFNSCAMLLVVVVCLADQLLDLKGITQTQDNRS